MADRRGTPKNSSITADVYLAAGREHATAGFTLLESRFFVLAHYVAGLAVECVIRAYRTRAARPFDERHDLYELARSANFFALFPPQRAQKLSEAFGIVTTQWANGHRYRSEASLRKFLTERKLFAGVKGDLLHVRTRLIVNAAFDLVTLGEAKWKS